MFKYKSELIILIILIPILAYVGWQAYKSYFKTPDMEEFEKVATKEPVKPVAPPIVDVVAEQPHPPIPSTPKGTLDYKGFTKRDPLKPSLPVKEKIEKPPEKIPEKVEPSKTIVEPSKIIVLPTFTVTGITWGQSPRAIIDNSVYKIGDIVKGAKILDITKQGIQLIYEGKEFFVTIQ